MNSDFVSAVEDAGFVTFRWNGRDQSPGEGTRGALEQSPSSRVRGAMAALEWLIGGWLGAVVI